MAEEIILKGKYMSKEKIQVVYSSAYPKQLIIRLYAGYTVFCIVFCLIYYRFSHGVHSASMTGMFLWPLLLGVLPGALLLLIRSLPEPSDAAGGLYHAGVITASISSCLRGIMEIAGNSSVYQVWMMIAGIGMILAGGIIYLIEALRKRK